MFNMLIQQLVTRSGWGGLLVAVLQDQYESISSKFRELKRRIFWLMCTFLLGIGLLFLCVVYLSAWLVMAHWNDQPLHIVAMVGFGFGVLGILLLRITRIRINQL